MTTTRRINLINSVLSVRAIRAALLAMVLVGMAVGLTPAEAEEAASEQEPQFLVSNLGVGIAGSGGIQRTLSAGRSGFAQAFTTGTETDGYALGSVGIQVSNFYDASTVGDHLQVTINGVASGGGPGDALCTLTNPPSVPTPGVSAFGAATGAGSCPQLAKETTYFVVIEWVDPSGTGSFALIPQTYPTEESAATGEDPGGAEGWSIADRSHYLNVSTDARTWTAFVDTASFKIVVKEAAVTVAPDPGPLTVFTVVDASTDPDTLLGALEDGGTLTLAAPDSDIYGIRVDTDSNHDDHDDIQNVVLALSGAKDVSRPEKHSPYSLYGDSGEENLTGEDLPVGSYALTATAHRANGDVSGTLTVSFTVAVAPESGPLTAFTLVDTSTDPDKVLGTLEDGRTLTLAAPAGDSYGIRVDTESNDDIQKVELALSRAKTEGKTEWEPPYSLYGDSGEDNLTGEDLPAGSYDLTATAYKNNGDVMGTLKVSFSVAYADPAEEQPPAQNTLATGAPTITGIARVGETLTADTSGISDDDGLDNATFSYQWTRSDGGSDTNITGSTYTLVARPTRARPSR